jgi:hypothetical protein
LRTKEQGTHLTLNEHDDDDDDDIINIHLKLPPIYEVTWRKKREHTLELKTGSNRNKTQTTTKK